MSPFFRGLILGVFLGANVGLVVLSLCVAAKRGDEG
jgi:hypothetical protein